MVAEIQELEAAARMAMGHIEGPDAALAKPAPRPRTSAPALALLALAAAFGLALILL